MVERTTSITKIHVQKPVLDVMHEERQEERSPASYADAIVNLEVGNVKKTFPTKKKVHKKSKDKEDEEEWALSPNCEMLLEVEKVKMEKDELLKAKGGRGRLRGHKAKAAQVGKPSPKPLPWPQRRVKDLQEQFLRKAPRPDRSDILSDPPSRIYPRTPRAMPGARAESRPKGSSPILDRSRLNTTSLF